MAVNMVSLSGACGGSGAHEGEGDPAALTLEASGLRKEILRLRARLAAAEQSRLSGQPTVSLEESRKRLETIYGQRA